MTRVRAFLPTYRRHTLLPRALESLQRQVFQDWVCEVHNDDPEDPFPGELVANARDPRIRIVNHQKNLGGAATMNAFYAPAKEEFVSILEDDNWWEPEFLEEMVNAAEKHPHVTVFWSNMKIWQEQADGSFVFTGKETYPEEPGKTYEEFWWPDCRQILGAIHSNGACLIRADPRYDFRIPAVPFTSIEMFRERLFPYPLLLVKKPLANYSITKSTERSRDGQKWSEAQAILCATFLKEACWSSQEAEQVFKEGRKKNPPSTHAYLNAALISPACRPFLGFATWQEKIRWILSLLKRPSTLIGLVRSRVAHPEWWQFLEKHTANQFGKARKRTK
jgi:hypothetical protein